MKNSGYTIAEFESGGKTYRIRAERPGGEVTFNPYYFVNQVRDSVDQYTDLLTNQTITVNWQQIGVIRILETSK